MIASSRRRLLAHMAAGHADEAALEMENHLRGLHYMWRLAAPGSPRPVLPGHSIILWPPKNMGGLPMT